MSIRGIFGELKSDRLHRLFEEESEERELPKEDHIYWDHKHENAYLVVSVYPEDNKVSYWTADGMRLETTIDNFIAKYEISTNEDDYDLFEEVTSKSDPNGYEGEMLRLVNVVSNTDTAEGKYRILQKLQNTIERYQEELASLEKDR